MARVYIRLRSKTTGHQWDASEAAARAYLATGGCEVARPPRFGSRPLRPKHLRTLAGQKPRPRTPRSDQ